jgi:hypothetical protein
MIEGNALDSDGFTHAVKIQGHVAFMPVNQKWSSYNALKITKAYPNDKTVPN